MIQLLPPHNAPEVLLLPAHDYWGSIIRGMQDFAAAMSAAAMSGAADAALATTSQGPQGYQGVQGAQITRAQGPQSVQGSQGFQGYLGDPGEAQSAPRSILVLAEAERRCSRAARISKKMFGGVI
jgi:hypothetical protein